MVRPAVLALMLLLSCSASVAETLRIASGEYPPWATKELPDGGYINLIVTMAFDQVGIDAQFDYMPWNRALEATRVGSYMASSFWGRDPAREVDFLHSDTIYHDPIVLAYKPEHTDATWARLEDLRGYIFGATRGYTYSEGFWNLAKQDVLRVSIANNDVDNLKKLIQGQIDFFPISKITGRYLLHQQFSRQEASQITFDTKPINASQDHLLFTRAKPEARALMLKFNRGLALLRESHDIKALRTRYMNKCCAFPE